MITATDLSAFCWRAHSACSTVWYFGSVCSKHWQPCSFAWWDRTVCCRQTDGILLSPPLWCHPWTMTDGVLDPWGRAVMVLKVLLSMGFSCFSRNPQTASVSVVCYMC